MPVALEGGEFFGGFLHGELGGFEGGDLGGAALLDGLGEGSGGGGDGVLGADDLARASAGGLHAALLGHGATLAALAFIDLAIDGLRVGEAGGGGGLEGRDAGARATETPLPCGGVRPGGIAKIDGAIVIEVGLVEGGGGFLERAMHGGIVGAGVDLCLKIILPLLERVDFIERARLGGFEIAIGEGGGFIEDLLLGGESGLLLAGATEFEAGIAGGFERGLFLFSGVIEFRLTREQLAAGLRFAERFLHGGFLRGLLFGRERGVAFDGGNGGGLLDVVEFIAEALHLAQLTILRSERFGGGLRFGVQQIHLLIEGGDVVLELLHDIEVAPELGGKIGPGLGGGLGFTDAGGEVAVEENGGGDGGARGGGGRADEIERAGEFGERTLQGEDGFAGLAFLGREFLRGAGEFFLSGRGLIGGLGLLLLGDDGFLGDDVGLAGGLLDGLKALGDVVEGFGIGGGLDVDAELGIVGHVKC